MQIAPFHPNEELRLASLKELNILNTIPEKEYDDLTLLASQICQVPIALISLIEKDRQWFKSKIGIDQTETKRDISFCSHAILENKPLVVTNAAVDVRFKDNPLVTGPTHIRFYAGVPIMSLDGLPIGTICVLDTKPCELTPEQIRGLEALASQVGILLQLRLQIRDLKTAQNKLYINQRALESMSEGFVLQDKNDKIIESNKAAAKVLDLTLEQLSGKSSMDPLWKAIKEDGSPYKPEEHPSVVCMQTGKSQRGAKMGIQVGNGPTKWLKINSDPLYLSDGKTPSHTVTIFADITHEVNYNNDLVHAKKELRFLLDSIPHKIAYFDKYQNNISSNKEFAECFGQSTESVKGMKLSTLIGKGLNDIFQPQINAALDGESKSFESEMTTVSGDTKNVFISFIPRKTSEDNGSFIILIMDITKIKNLEAERRTLEARLVESSRLSTLGEMAGGLAHEINNPLTIIRGIAASTKRKIKTSQINTDDELLNLEKIELTVDRIAKIIKGLRTYSRNAENDPMEKISLLQILNESLAICIEKFKNSEIEIKIEASPEVEIMGRAAQISQIFINLLNNSYDAVTHLNEKWVKIKIYKSGSKAVLEITDSGHGINPDISKKIMMPFFTTKEVGKGTGLGLSIVQGIVEVHGGIFSYNAHKPNTTFNIELPIALDA